MAQKDANTTIAERRSKVRQEAIRRDREARKRIEANRQHLARKRLSFTIM